MEHKIKLMDEAAVARSLARITHEISERNRGVEGICLLGVKRRGVPIAKRLAENMKKFEGVTVPVGSIDITLYRDDLTETDDLPTAEACDIPCDVRTHHVIIVDDVMFTGRTARAAMEAVFRYGRPRSLQLAVLIDRGHRELPIRPDFVGKNIPTAKSERVFVMLAEHDGETAVYLK
ncbi:MAG: bifunctional pyr operon transcriptional regulator/uracil phosphoribosyltransferase PyrR [Clostridia bacterium]|nr:bifunctional pyr operon transcriptional regulator/uracil phosphoribosyltransferase PyrR [Clostridia bacterium]